MNNSQSIPSDSIPKHVAIIMDGNGRWAERRNRPRVFGHRAGVESVRRVVQYCQDVGIQNLTLFAFSSENWKRPPDEVRMLMELFFMVLRREVKRLNRNNVRLRVIGDTSKFEKRLQQHIAKAEEETQHNTALNLNIAANYGGRWDIAQAAHKLCEKVLASELSIEDLTPEAISDELAISELPEPDLFIRTGGEQRISNFMLWQLAYTELYFTETLWPDFHEEAMAEAITSYSQRQRRFGMTSAQIVAATEPEEQ